MNIRKFKSRVQRMIVKSKAVIKDKNRKNIFRILKETTIIAVKQRCLPTHYFSEFLYRKGVGNYLGYLTARECLKLHRASHYPETQQILDNKLLFHEHFLKLGMPLPKRLAYNFKNMWFIDQKEGLKNVEIKSVDDFIALASAIFQDNEFAALFAKPLLLSFGRGAIKISQDIFTSFQLEQIKKLYDHLNNGCVIIQEYVIQHPEMSKLNDSSLNTIRIATFNSLKGSPEIISALLRMGRSGSVVDNSMSGGIFIGIYLDSGRLHDNAMAFLENSGMIYDKHPDSGVAFKDFTIPYFREAKDLACKAARLLSEKLVGWDIGFSPNGPILIEGNAYFDLGFLDLLDVEHGHYRNNPVFRKAMVEAGIKISG